MRTGISTVTQRTVDQPIGWPRGPSNVRTAHRAAVSDSLSGAEVSRFVQRGTLRRPVFASGLAIAVLASATACSSGSGSSKPSGSTPPASAANSASGSGVAAAAQALVTKQLASPTGVGVSTPLSKKPPTGLSIVEVGATDSLSLVRTKGEQAAAEALGWHFTHITPGPGAEDVQKAVQSALQLSPKPFAITVSALGKESYLPQLAQAKQMGIHVIENSALDAGGTGDGIDATVNQAANSLIEPQQMAAWIAVDSGGKADVLELDLPSIPIVHHSIGVFQQYLKQYCSGCTTTVVPVQVSDVGVTVPQNVVSQIQKNSKLNYLFSLGLVTTGVPAALTSAGLGKGKLKFVGLGPDPDNLQGLRNKDGFNYAWSAFAPSVSGWQTVDVAARLSVRDSITDVMKQVSPTQILTPTTIATAVQDSGGNYIGVADYQTLFKRMWLVG